VFAPLALAQGFHVGVEFVEDRAGLLLAGREVAPEHLLADGEPLVQVELLDLLGDAALHVVDGEAAGTRVLGLDDVEQVAVREALPDAVVLGAGPGLDPIHAEIVRRVAFDLRQHGLGVVGMLIEVVVALHGRDQGEEVFFELQADELLAPDVPQGLWTSRVGLVPGIIHGLGYEVYPAAVSG